MLVSGYIDLNKHKIHTFDVYGHFEFIEDNYRHIDRIDEILNGINSVHESCESLIENGEHPEWHCYEMAKDSSESTINAILMNNNILRLNCNNGTLFIDTIGEKYHGNNQKEKLKKLLSFSNIHFTKVKIYLNDSYKTIDFTYDEFMENV